VSLAGPSRPQDRVALSAVKKSFHGALEKMLAGTATQASHGELTRLKGEGGAATSAGAPEPTRLHSDLPGPPTPAAVDPEEAVHTIAHGAVVIAAITSCTNTSNPSVMMAAGLLAKKAVEKGLRTKLWVKTSLAPGSKVVTEYLARAGLLAHLEQLGFHVVGYGCTTCIGNSGPLPLPVSRAIEGGDLVACAVLSGNRNFEGRVHREVRANYLASPPLVVAYALAGTVDIDLTKEPLGKGRDGEPVFLRDIWPTRKEVEENVHRHIARAMYREVYAHVFDGDEQWRKLAVPDGDLFRWDPASTYVKHPPYFVGMKAAPDPVQPLHGARCLAVLGDSITTDHISPAGSIEESSPAGRYLVSHGVAKKDFNTYGARRGNHEVMVRGTFANIRLRNRLAPGTEGGLTRHQPGGELMSIFDAAMRYERDGVPVVVLGGKEYGAGSSRDWAAKGPRLLGVRAVIAESYERIHRSNLIGMGVLPLQFRDGESAGSHGLTGREVFDVEGIPELVAGGLAARELTVKAKAADGAPREIAVRVRIDTPNELEYYRHGGILLYVLRQLLARK
jgi:aconitate hydratase